MMRQWRLGDLIERLERCEPSAIVRFDFGLMYPSGLCSYRGYYDQLTIRYTEKDYKNEWPLVGAFLAELRAAVGGEFEGYKGGVYRMRLDTPLWVSLPRDASDIAVVGCECNEYSAVILTAHVEHFYAYAQK